MFGGRAQCAGAFRVAQLSSRIVRGTYCAGRALLDRGTFPVPHDQRTWGANRLGGQARATSPERQGCFGLVVFWPSARDLAGIATHPGGIIARTCSAHRFTAVWMNDFVALVEAHDAAQRPGHKPKPVAYPVRPAASHAVSMSGVSRSAIAASSAREVRGCSHVPMVASSR